MTSERDDWRLCLRGHRDVRGLTSVEVAQRAGISRTHLWNIETGRKWPTTPVAERIAAVLGMPPAVLLGYEAETVDRIFAALPQALEIAGYGERTGDLDQYQEWGGSPREIAQKVVVCLRAALKEQPR